MPIAIKDQINTLLSFKSVPKRIVSLVPSQTELLYDLGLGPQLVGITKFCVHPSNIKKQSSIVGGTKQINLNKIRDLRPDIILCNKEENTKAIVDACKTVSQVHVSDIQTLNDSIALIEQYGVLFNKSYEAEILVNNIKQKLNDFKNFVKHQPIKKVSYFIWKDPWMVAGKHTFINHLLQLNRYENVYGNKLRYPEINWPLVVPNTQVELVMLSSEPFPFTEKHKAEVQHYYPNSTVLLVDGEMFSWYGSRLIKAFDYFKKLRVNL